MATVEKHLFIRDDDTVGRLADITRRIKETGANIHSLVGYAEGGQATFIIGASDLPKAKAALKGHVKVLDEMEVVVVNVPDKPGALNRIAEKIAEAGISIGLAVATGTGGGEAAIVFSTSGNAKVAKLF